MNLSRLLCVLALAGCSSNGVAALGDGGGMDATETRDAVADGGTDAVHACSPPPTLTWTPEPVNFGTSDLVSIWGTSSTDVYAGTDFGTVYQLSNGHWTQEPLGDGAVIGAGWGSDPHNHYAAGASAWMGIGTGSLFHSSGDGGWAPVPGVGSGINSVWGTSASDVYAAGGAGMLHSRAGGPFTNELVPGTPLSVWGSGPGDVYATEFGSYINIVHSSGDGGWSNALLDVADFPWVVWGSGPSDVYAIFSPNFLSEATAFVMHSGGDGGWTTEPVDQTRTVLVSLWGSCPNDVYVGGWHEDASGGIAGGALYHSMGDGKWTPVAVPLQQVRCIWGSSASDIYVGGFSNVQGTVLMHGHP